MSDTTFGEIISRNWTQYEIDAATLTNANAAFASEEFHTLASETAFGLIADLAIIHGVPIGQVPATSPAVPGQVGFLRSIARNVREGFGA